MNVIGSTAFQINLQEVDKPITQSFSRRLYPNED